jgi:hypothetical protein
MPARAPNTLQSCRPDGQLPGPVSTGCVRTGGGGSLVLVTALDAQIGYDEPVRVADVLLRRTSP